MNQNMASDKEEQKTLSLLKTIFYMELELIKEYDKEGQRTIGVLTKIDLMNENSDIVDYLENNISNNLKSLDNHRHLLEFHHDCIVFHQSS